MSKTRIALLPLRTRNSRQCVLCTAASCSLFALFALFVSLTASPWHFERVYHPRYRGNDCILVANECVKEPPLLTPCNQRHNLYAGCWSRNQYARTSWHPNSCSLVAISIYVFQKISESSQRDLWIYFLGDSSTRGLYCSLHEHLQEFTAPNRLNESGCDPAKSAESTGMEFSFHILPIYLASKKVKVSWTYLGSIADDPTVRLLRKLLPFNNSVSRPDILIYNSGAYEHYNKYDDIGNQVGRVRAGGAAAMVAWLRGLNFSGMFFYRNSICNKRFDARRYDEEVERVFVSAGFRVVNAWALSLGRVYDSTYDGFHMDRTRGKSERLWENMKNIGSLNDAILAAILQELLNEFDARYKQL